MKNINLELVVDLLTGQHAEITAGEGGVEVRNQPPGFRGGLNLQESLNLEPLSINYDRVDVNGSYTKLPDRDGIVLKLGDGHNSAQARTFIGMLHKMLPDADELKRKNTQRVSFFIPTEASDENSDGVQLTHYHIKADDSHDGQKLGLTTLINNPDYQFGERLLTAMSLVNLGGIGVRAKDNVALQSLIQSTDMFQLFDIYSRDSAKQLAHYVSVLNDIYTLLLEYEGATTENSKRHKKSLKAKVKKYAIELAGKQSCPDSIVTNLINAGPDDFSSLIISPSAPQPDVLHRFDNKNRYLILPKMGEKYWQPDAIGFEYFTKFKRFHLREDSKRFYPHNSGEYTVPRLKSEEQRQALLRGVSYMMSIFSGTIVTMEFEGKDTYSEYESNHFVLSKTKPVVLAPLPLVDMWLDLAKYCPRLDQLHLDVNKKPKELKCHKPKELKLRSEYSVKVLKAVAHTAGIPIKLLNDKEEHTGPNIPLDFPDPGLYEWRELDTDGYPVWRYVNV